MLVGVDFVKACFDVQEEDGDRQPWSLQGPHFMHEGGTGIGSGQAWEGAALVGVEEAFRAGQGPPPSLDLQALYITPLTLATVKTI